MKVKYIDHMGTDLSVVNAARVSFNKVSEWEDVFHDPDNPFDFTQKLSFADDKLIKYLAKHKHTSPFGHAFISVHVKAPVFVARQLVKHKFLRWNEISRRYVDDEPEFYLPPTWRGKPIDAKQGSSEEVVNTAYYDRDDGYQSYEDDAINIALESYTKMIKLGVAPEQARMILPLNMYTEWYWSGSLDAFADMCKLRCKPDSQYETQLIANQVRDIIKPLFPVSFSCLMEEK